MKQKTENTYQKSILITGCSSGVGQASALYLARHGVTVFAAVRKEADAESLRRLGLPDLIPLCPLDLTQPQQIEAAVTWLQEELQRRGLHGLDGVLHNAGGGGPAPIEMLEPVLLQTQLHIRVVGSMALTQAVLPLLRQAGGRLLWIATPALIPTPYVTGIHAADFAVACLARTLEIELKPWHIASILIRCGGIQTPAGARTISDIETLLQKDVLGKADLYASALQKWLTDMAEFDAHRTPPERVAEVVYRAFTASRPRHRYAVGHLAMAAAFLEALPAPLCDALLKARY